MRISGGFVFSDSRKDGGDRHGHFSAGRNGHQPSLWWPTLLSYLTKTRCPLPTPLCVCVWGGGGYWGQEGGRVSVYVFSWAGRRRGQKSALSVCIGKVFSVVGFCCSSSCLLLLFFSFFFPSTDVCSKELLLGPSRPTANIHATINLMEGEGGEGESERAKASERERETDRQTDRDRERQRDGRLQADRQRQTE